jgi:hypothetical protein
MGLIFDRAALYHDHKPASLLHTLDTLFLIRGGQLVTFLTDNSFHPLILRILCLLFEIVSFMILYRFLIRFRSGD